MLTDRSFLIGLGPMEHNAFLSPVNSTFWSKNSNARVLVVCKWNNRGLTSTSNYSHANCALLFIQTPVSNVKNKTCRVVTISKYFFICQNKPQRILNTFVQQVFKYLVIHIQIETNTFLVIWKAFHIRGCFIFIFFPKLLSSFLKLTVFSNLAKNFKIANSCTSVDKVIEKFKGKMKINNRIYLLIFQNRFLHDFSMFIDLWFTLWFKWSSSITNLIFDIKISKIFLWEIRLP